jgi:hypothetical protein
MIGRLFGCVAVCWGLMASSTLQGHHSLMAVYDMETEEAVSGTLVQIQFVNPHGSLTMSVKNPDGTTTVWTFTTGSAAVLADHGIGKNSGVLKAGDQITAKFFPARMGRTSGPILGFLKSITTADGTTFETSSGKPVL